GQEFAGRAKRNQSVNPLPDLPIHETAQCLDINAAGWRERRDHDGVGTAKHLHGRPSTCSGEREQRLRCDRDGAAIDCTIDAALSNDDPILGLYTAVPANIVFAIVSILAARLMSVTLKDVAHAARVSVSTASRALGG